MASEGQGQLNGPQKHGGTPPAPWLLPSHLMITPEVRKICGLNGQPIQRHTLLNWRARHGFPEPVRSIKVGRGRNAQTVDIYDRRMVRAWLKAHPPATNLITPEEP